MKQDGKQRLIEVMQRLDKTFKTKLNEEFGAGTDDPTKEEMVGFLMQQFAGSELEMENMDFDIAAAIYWFANDYHGGQSSNLYSALSTSDYRPGPMHKSIEDDESETATQMYQELVDKYSGDAPEQEVAEVFGWSAKEKETKGNQEQTNNAKAEIAKYPPSHLWGQPGRNSSPQDDKQLMTTRLNMAKQAMPTLAELMPQLFDLNQGYGDMVQIYNGKPLRGLMPSNWYYFLRGTEGYVDNEQAVQKLNQEIDVLGQKMGLEEDYGDAPIGTPKPREPRPMGGPTQPMIEKEDKWIQKAVDPAHKGYCTPMTKDTCTPRRKALAKRFKAGIEDESIMEAFVGDDPEEYRIMVEKLKQSMDNLFQEQHFDVIDTLYRLIVERKRPLANAPQVNEKYDSRFDDEEDDPDAGHTVNGRALSPEEYRKWKEEEGEYDDMDKQNRPRW